MPSDRPAARSKSLGAAVFAAVVVIGGALISYKVVQQIRIGAFWDTYSFLANAAEFAGKGFGYSELHRPPLLSLITAAFFAVGMPLNVPVIQWIDGAISLSGLIAFYLLARRRFEPLLAGLGALLLLAVQPVWEYLGSGYTDFPSVALSLWLLWACAKATEDDPKWYLAAGPLFMAALMMRYTAILIAFPAAIWVVLRWKPFHDAKYLFGGAGLALASFVPAAKFYGERFGDVLFQFLVAFGMYEDFSEPSAERSAKIAAGWYAGKLPSFLADERVLLAALVVLAVAALGLGLGVFGYFQAHRPRAKRLAIAITALAPAVLAQIGGGLVLRQFTIPVAVLGLTFALGPFEDTPQGRRVTPSAALLAVMMAWLLAYFDFHGHQRIEVSRYVTTMAPSLAFLLVEGWRLFVDDIRGTLARGNIVEGRGPLVLAATYAAPAGLGLFLAITLATTALATAAKPKDPWVIAARESGAYLAQQPDAPSATVLSELWPMTAWYAQMPVKAMPRDRTQAAYQHLLDKNLARYCVTIHDESFAGYEVAEATSNAEVLARASTARADLPRIAYLGKAWDNYLEEVAGYSFYLMGDQGPQEWGDMAYIDALPAAELADYDAVAIYGVRWHSRAEGEKLLTEYLEQGGTVVMDASANLGKLPYDLQDIVMFDTVLKRGTLRADAPIEVGPELVAIDPSLAAMSHAPFAEDDGGAWYGAEYSSLPAAHPLEVLAEVDGKPLVAMRRIGAGRVYWIGYNLAWHAFWDDDAAEKRLVEAVFADALTGR